jgi:hypothetical protein
MTLDDYNKTLAQGAGNPGPIDVIALVFAAGRAGVYVRIPGSDQWREVLSAPTTAEEGLACGVDLRRDYRGVTADHGMRLAMLDDYNKYLAELMEPRGNPRPIDALALVFEAGRACVHVRAPESVQWREALSAPATSEDGLCGVDFRCDYGFVTVDQGIASGGL